MKKIFIIDNLNSIVELYSDFLSLKGYEIAVATTVEDFMDKQNKFHADLIIYDTDMPGRESEKFSSYISTFPGIISTPIIFLTGFVNESKLKSFEKFHNSTFLNKNSSNSQIIKRVNYLMDDFRKKLEPRKINRQKPIGQSTVLNH